MEAARIDAATDSLDSLRKLAPAIAIANTDRGQRIRPRHSYFEGTSMFNRYCFNRLHALVFESRPSRIPDAKPRYETPI